MTQLIINGLVLPQTSRDKYQCYAEPLGSQLEMISGRLVTELRGTVQRIVWSYDYLGDALCRPLLATLRSGRSFPVSYLPDDGDKLVDSIFLRTSLTNPTFAFSRGGKPYWHNIAFELREVSPHG